MIRTVTVVEASEQFDQLLEKVISGEDEIIISQNGTPIARLMPIASMPIRRVPGCDTGKFAVPVSFFEPLPDEVVDGFYR